MGVPFECYLCSFRNVCGRNPVWRDRTEQFTLTAIRRVNIEVMWAREPDTVATNWRRERADYLTTRKNLSIDDFLPVLGSERVEDRVGMKPALITLVTSLREGRYSSNIQWDTMRKTQRRSPRTTCSS